MNQPFPALESLELHCINNSKLGNSPPFLTAPTPHLRRLQFIGSPSKLLFNILSHTTSIVDLTLSLGSVIGSSFEFQLLAHLQDMSFLHHLELNMSAPGASFLKPPLRNKDVLLPKLTFLHFTGHVAQLEALFAGLAAPSLRELHITPYSISSVVTYLPRFI